MVTWHSTPPSATQRSAEIVGKTISGAGLRGIPGLFLVSVQRSDGAAFDSHDHSLRILAGDELVFAADLKSITLLSRFPGLVLSEQPQVEKLGVDILDRVFLEAVVSSASHLVGRTAREVAFRSTYGAVLLAVHRQGERVAATVGDLRLAAGDMLLLSAGTSWPAENEDNEDFVLVATVPDSSPHKTRKMVRDLGGPFPTSRRASRGATGEAFASKRARTSLTARSRTPQKPMVPGSPPR